MIKRINHFAIVGKNTDDRVALFNKLFGFEVLETIPLPREGFKSTTIGKDDVRVELLEPLGHEGAIAKFLEERGTSLHHVSLQVDNLEKVMQELIPKGVKFVSEKPIVVNATDRVNFIHPGSTGGILIEMIESSR
jgi:methylmalonyl-CoA/ethylmalonyl-CoA epimerase